MHAGAENLSEQGREPTTKPTTSVTTSPGIKRGTNCWEASTLTTASILSPKTKRTTPVNPKHKKKKQKQTSH